MALAARKTRPDRLARKISWPATICYEGAERWFKLVIHRLEEGRPKERRDSRFHPRR